MAPITDGMAKKIVASTPAGLYIYYFRKKANIFINQQYTEILGYTLAELNEISAEEFLYFFHPEDRQGILNRMEGLSRGEKVEIEYRFKHKNGNWVWCSSIDSPFEYDKSGKVISFIGSFTNISKSKSFEIELLETLKESKRIGHELKNARDKAESASKAKRRIRFKLIKNINRRRRYLWPNFDQKTFVKKGSFYRGSEHSTRCQKKVNFRPKKGAYGIYLGR